MKCFLLLLIHFSSASSPTEILRSLHSALKENAFQLVGIHYTGYNNAEEPAKNWAKCEYCVNCPDPDPQRHALDTTKLVTFYPCPSELRSLKNKLMSSAERVDGIEQRYISEFIGFSNNSFIHVVRRVCDHDGEEETSLSHFPPEGNVFKVQLDLEKIFFDQMMDPNSVKPEGKELSWVGLSKNPKVPQVIRILQGASPSPSLQGWKLTETRSTFQMREGLHRHTVYRNMVELQELLNMGCACIRSRFQTFAGNSDQLIEDCRKELKTSREEIRQAVALSSCLSPEEKESMKIHLHSTKIEL